MPEVIWIDEPPHVLRHEEDCYSGYRCVACGGCDCGLIPATCTGAGPEGCQSIDDHEQEYDEAGYDENDGCSYGCH